METPQLLWKSIVRDWSCFRCSPEKGSVEERSTNDALIESLVEEFQHYTLFDKYYSFMVQTIIDGFPEQERGTDYNSQRGKIILNKSRRFFRELRRIIFPEAPPFRCPRLFLCHVDATGVVSTTDRDYAVSASAAGGESAASASELDGDLSAIVMNVNDASAAGDGSAAAASEFGGDMSPSTSITSRKPFSQLTEEDIGQRNDESYDFNNDEYQEQDYFSLAEEVPNSTSVCVLCQRNETEDMSRDGNTIIEGGCGCSASMCRGCWKDFYVTNLTSPSIVFIACPVCKQNVLPYLKIMFPHIKYEEGIPEDIREYWIAQTRGERIPPPSENYRRVCKLCNRVTDPPHTRRTCCFKQLRRQFVESAIRNTRSEVRYIESTLLRSKERLQQVEDELIEAKEEVKWNENDLRDLRKILLTFERELDDV
jgi:hypothetical protein